MANQTLILKGIVGALQIGLIILLIISGVHFKDFQQFKDLLDLIKSTLQNPGFEELAFKVDIKYFALLILIILSTLKVPVIAVGLFRSDIIIFFGSFGIDLIVGGLYFAQWVLFTDAYATGSWLRILCSVASGIMTVILIRFIRRDVRPNYESCHY